MPPAAQSRAKVTDTHGPFPVGEFHVCRVGGIVALHLATTSGRFVFHVREHSFVKHARGDRDANGHTFRSLAAIETEGTEAGEPTVGNRAEAAFRDLLADASLLIGDAAARHDVSEQTVSAWISNNHREQWAIYRAQRIAAKAAPLDELDRCRAARADCAERGLAAGEAATKHGLDPEIFRAWLEKTAPVA